ncbi:MAG: type IV pilin protein [Tepidimonas sp.]|uniref:type IV pilin protein n=1 Tax=Tepidimonas sp. TaxID=2002775 RepID=UPI00298EEC17|nr:type IV pilin protein [Tepidimonas sp.]MDW8336146.1 type IV pilin protein [Tepidimonas sp.]
MKVIHLVSLVRVRGGGRRWSGFTLIELLIAVAIIGILAAVAYPSYVEHVRSTRRAAAAACLQDLTQAMERHYTANLSYPASVPALSCNSSSETGLYYTYSFSSGWAAGTYELRATPTGSQAGDRCGTLLLDHLGAKKVVGHASGTSAATCWKQ